MRTFCTSLKANPQLLNFVGERVLGGRHARQGPVCLVPFALEAAVSRDRPLFLANDCTGPVATRKAPARGARRSPGAGSVLSALGASGVCSPGPARRSLFMHSFLSKQV